MKLKRCFCVALLLAMALSTAARADVVVPGQKPPRNEQSEAFVELYKEGLTTWNSAYDDAFRSADKRVLWRYPGSGQVTGVVEGYQTDWLPDDSPCYVDGEGRFWVYLTYIVGYRQSWICLSDPGNENLPADKEVVAVVDKEVTAMLWREWAPVIVLVAGAVTITAVLIYQFWYKKKKRG